MYYLVYDSNGRFIDALQLSGDKAFERWNETTPKPGLKGISIRVFTNSRPTTYGQFSDLKVASQKQLCAVLDAYLYAQKLANATPDRGGGTSCGSYQIERFNKNWDRPTVEGVARHVRVYVQSWVMGSLEQFFNEICPTEK